MNEDVAEKETYSVEEFCKAYGIKRGLFYKLRRDGKGPIIKKIGDRTLIGKTDAKTWWEAQ